jgi:hypothetical protein
MHMRPQVSAAVFHFATGFALVVLSEALPRVAPRLLPARRLAAPVLRLLLPGFCLGEGLVAMSIFHLQVMGGSSGSMGRTPALNSRIQYPGPAKGSP